MADQMTARPTRALLAHPRFESGLFWSYHAVCEAVDAKYPAPPFGFITVAAMAPEAAE